MTIGGAIAELQNLINANDVPFYYKGGIEKVIETILMELPTTEVSEDCISREWLIEEIARRDTTDGYVKTFGGREVNEIILNAPSVVPKDHIGESTDMVGEWNFKSITNKCHVTGKCSLCKERRVLDNYCSNCGAKMKG